MLSGSSAGNVYPKVGQGCTASSSPLRHGSRGWRRPYHLTGPADKPGSAGDCLPLQRPLSHQYHGDGLKQDSEVKTKRHVLDVIEVVLQLLVRVLDRTPIRVVHLRPTGDPRLHHMAQ